MPKFDTTRRVAHTPEQMFALVADIETYPQFLPLCEALTVRSRKQPVRTSSTERSKRPTTAFAAPPTPFARAADAGST